MYNGKQLPPIKKGQHTHVHKASCFGYAYTHAADSCSVYHSSLMPFIHPFTHLSHFFTHTHTHTCAHTRAHTHIDTHARTYFPFTRPHLSTPCPPLFRRKAAAAPRRSARNQGVHKSVSYDNVQMTRMNKPSVLAVTLKLYLW